MSIQRRLLLSVFAVMVSGIAITGGVVYRQARDEANALFDMQLRQFAASLPVRAFGALAPQAPGVPQAGEDVVIRIWNRFGVFVYSSHADVPLPARVELGLTTVRTSAGDWRVFAAMVDDNVLEVAQPLRVRTALAAEVALRTVVPLLILLPVLAGLLWWVVGRGLAPLRRVAGEVAARRPESLERLSEDALPEELAPLVASLNRLLADLATARDAQRAFIADAAHELRTPLTALQLQLQVAERAGDAAARTAALDALREGLERASRLVEQVLALARAEPDADPRAAPILATQVDAPGGNLAATRVDLRALAQESVAAHAHLALDRGIDLGIGPEAASTEGIDAAVEPQVESAIERQAPRADARPIEVVGDRDALFTLLGNLIDNALRYTPRGGRVDVAVERAIERGADEIVLSVSDNGPGIAPHERERVFDRFHRGEAARAASDTRGSGLGLAIVKRIAERHGAKVVIGEHADRPGLTIEVRFPRPVANPNAARNSNPFADSSR